MIHARAIRTCAALCMGAVVACGGNGGGRDDTSTDSIPDTGSDEVEGEVTACASDDDCDDECYCTGDSCNAETGVCEHVVTCTMCSTDLDCEDGDPCTIDSCEPEECGDVEGITACLSAPDPACGYDDCPEPGEFEFSLDWEPYVGTATSTGVVQSVLEDPTGTLVITVDLTAGGHAPGSYTFSVPFPAGFSIDLHADDMVSVDTRDLTGCIGCQIWELTIERAGVLVLYALDCFNEICNESSFEVGPLAFQVIGGICEPWEDGPSAAPDCYIKENSGLEVSCPDGPGTEQIERLFVGEIASMACTDGPYHVASGIQTRVLDYSGICIDYPGEERQVLVVRGAD